MAQQQMDQRIADLRKLGMGRRAAGEQAYREAVAATTTRHYAGIQTQTDSHWGDDPTIGWN